MNKFINANDVKELLIGLDSLPWEEEIDDIVDELPAADVVEVVRCKDCKHATFYSCKNDVCYQAIICEYQIGIGDENFFCSCGARKAQE